MPPSPVPADPHTTLARLRAGALRGATHLDLRGTGLTELPAEVLDLADTLEVLDVSGNALSTLPPSLARLQRLHTLFGSQNRFATLPPVLGRLPLLDTLGFKANQIADVPAEALAPSLRWLILTDNRVSALPDTLADCPRLQKLMLAGNRLTRLPAGIGRLRRLELLRIAANRFEQVDEALPAELLGLPELRWLAYAGNPFCAAWEAAGAASAVPEIAWSALTLQHRLGEGASGHIHAAQWRRSDDPTSAAEAVAVKLFKGALTSDGLPACEMAASLAAGSHPHLVGVHGRLVGHPDGAQGLVLPRLGPDWAALAGPPSMTSCSRDVYAPDLRLGPEHAIAIARGAGAALARVHARGLLHGDLYAHNLLVNGHGGALLSDFGAAAFLPPPAPDGDGAGAHAWRREALQALDRRALAVLVDELAQRCSDPARFAQACVDQRIGR